MSQPSPVGVYIHVPFCRRKCRYCDFCSRPPVGGSEMDRYTEAALAEVLAAGQGRRAGTVYFGGGTPSFLGGERLLRLLRGARDAFDVAPDAEITVEANPLDVTEAWAAAMLSAGVNRLSVGVQSIRDEDLRFLGRPHAAADGPKAVSVARDAGFVNISVDLIYGLPGAARASIERSLLDALDSCGPEHVSCYQLTYAPDTPLGRDMAAGRVAPLGEEEESNLFETVHETLALRGFEAYEVSNFARRRDHRSRHNLSYWRHVDYAGIGPGAHSFRWPDRWWNTRSVEEYCARIEAGGGAVDGRESLTLRQLAAESVMLGLRTTDGIDLREHRERFGEDLAVNRAEALARLSAEGLVVTSAGRVRPTLRGFAVADSLARELA